MAEGSGLLSPRFQPLGGPVEGGPPAMAGHLCGQVIRAAQPLKDGLRVHKPAGLALRSGAQELEKVLKVRAAGRAGVFMEPVKQRKIKSL